MNDQELTQAYGKLSGQTLPSEEKVLLWKQLREDARIAPLLKKTLFLICDEFPSLDECATIGYIISFLTKRSATLGVATWDDIIETDATIDSCELDESDDLSIVVGYSYRAAGIGKTLKFQRAVGYDLTHSGYAGWNAARLREYWRAGRILRCRYLSSEPLTHVIACPCGVSGVLKVMN
jgi:hypothetical protein